MGYTRIPAVYEKISGAVKQNRPVLLFAPFGFGKTAAVKDALQKTQCTYFEVKDGALVSMPPASAIKTKAVFIDDITFITDITSQDYIVRLLKNTSFSVILAGRRNSPTWLISSIISLDFVRINSIDLTLGAEQIYQMFRQAGISLAADEAELIAETSDGYPVFVSSCLRHALDGETVDHALFLRCKEELWHYFDDILLRTLSKDQLMTVFSICFFDSFTPELVDAVTGAHDSQSFIDSILDFGDILEKDGESWRFHPAMIDFLRYKAEMNISYEERRDDCRRAAYYYERNGDIPAAMKYYSLALSQENLKRLLIKNAEKHPGTGHYFETREYYFSFPKEAILNEPVLIAGMSMLCSITLRPEESEEWYEQLKLFEKDTKRSREERRTARARLAYLDIALPHRAGAGVMKIFKNAFTLIMNHDIEMPEMSVTSNIPSLMNGGLDFCDWSKNDTNVARFMAKPVETVLGRYGKGLVNIAMAESGFEKGTMSPYEVITRLGNGSNDADNGGRIELCFAAAAISVKQHLIKGLFAAAKNTVESFERKIKAENALILKKNWTAFRAWFSLYTGDMNTARNYLAEAPDEHVGFCILDRYRYMIKIRCLIAENKTAEALDLAVYLTNYYERYKRTYLWIENEILKSVMLFRQEDTEWQKTLAGALKKAQEYHFIRVFSLEGAALIPLLRAFDAKNAGIDEKFFTAIRDETSDVAFHYPDYLRFIPGKRIDLTEREQQILTMLCGGMNTDDICSELDISYSGLKKHNRSIYKKLGAKNRAEAERNALSYGLIKRKEV